MIVHETVHSCGHRELEAYCLSSFYLREFKLRHNYTDLNCCHQPESFGFDPAVIGAARDGGAAFILEAQNEIWGYSAFDGKCTGASPC